MASEVAHLVFAKMERPLTREEKLLMRSKLLQIPGVLSVSAGENYTKRGLEYTTGIVVRLTSKEAEVAYQTHPLHIYCRDNILKPLIVKGSETTPPLLVIDYEWKEPATWTQYLPAISFAAGVAVGVCALLIRK